MYQDNYFVVSVKINFCQRQTKCIDDQDKFQSVKDTDNEFTECQTPRKKLQSIGISPVTLHAKILYCFQRKTPNCEYWVLKVLYLGTQIVCSGWLKNDSLYLRMKHSSRCCAACRCNGRRLDIQRPAQINFALP